MESGRKNFSKCAFCELTRQCSRDCQKAHWKQEHKEECHRVVCESCFQAARQGRIDDIKRFLKKGFRVNSRMDHAYDGGQTALHSAVEGGHVEIVALLLENKAGVDKATSKGRTPLYIASRNGHLKAVTCLVEDGKAEIDKAMNHGETPLFTASQNGHLEVFQYLMEEGKADVGKVTEDGETALELAKWKGHEVILKFLKGKGAKD